MPAFKRRAFKTIQLEMGGHELEIPKYALDFLINCWLHPNTSMMVKTPLCCKRLSQKHNLLTSKVLEAFLSIWVESTLPLPIKLTAAYGQS